MVKRLPNPPTPVDPDTQYLLERIRFYAATTEKSSPDEREDILRALPIITALTRELWEDRMLEAQRVGRVTYEQQSALLGFQRSTVQVQINHARARLDGTAEPLGTPDTIDPATREVLGRIAAYASLDRITDPTLDPDTARHYRETVLIGLYNVFTLTRELWEEEIHKAVTIGRMSYRRLEYLLGIPHPTLQSAADSAVARLS